jgi:hypothetical protein
MTLSASRSPLLMSLASTIAQSAASVGRFAAMEIGKLFVQSWRMKALFPAPEGPEMKSM